VFSALQEPGSIMSFCLASLLFKKFFNDIEPSTWHVIYSHEYDYHDIHCQVVETTVFLYRKLSDPKKLQKFIKSNSHWGFLILNEDNNISLVHSIHCMTNNNEEYIGIIGNELLSPPIQIKFGDLAISKQWFLEEELTKHLVYIISICGYYDDEDPLPTPNDDDITSYEQALIAKQEILRKKTLVQKKEHPRQQPPKEMEFVLTLLPYSSHLGSCLTSVRHRSIPLPILL
jgi:hypothetical protein